VGGRENVGSGSGYRGGETTTPAGETFQGQFGTFTTR
jgi:hypothetical protein